MAKKLKAQFGEVTDGEGQSGRRANLETVDKPEEQAGQEEGQGAGESEEVSPAAGATEEASAPVVENATDPKPAPTTRQPADSYWNNQQCDEAIAAMASKFNVHASKTDSEDKAHKQHKLNRIHFQTIKELSTNKGKGKVHYSDGHRELIQRLAGQHL